VCDEAIESSILECAIEYRVYVSNGRWGQALSVEFVEKDLNVGGAERGQLLIAEGCWYEVSFGEAPI
jgi:hypothetical protein